MVDNPFISNLHGWWIFFQPSWLTNVFVSNLHGWWYLFPTLGVDDPCFQPSWLMSLNLLPTVMVVDLCFQPSWLIILFQPSWLMRLFPIMVLLIYLTSLTEKIKLKPLNGKGILELARLKLWASCFHTRARAYLNNIHGFMHHKKWIIHYI